MAKTTAERQRDFAKRNLVVLTATAEIIAKKLGAMEDKVKLRKIIALLLRQEKHLLARFAARRRPNNKQMIGETRE
jgi:hypothetical protein